MRREDFRVAAGGGISAREALRRAAAELESIDARLLLQHVLGATHADLAAHPDQPVEGEQLRQFNSLIERRAAGEPIAYILGHREFYGLDFKVTPAVLIPRPETELVVDLALEIIRPASPVDVLDLGTGSGAIAIAIASRRALARICAVDCSAAALDLARENAARVLGPAQSLEFLQSQWLGALGARRFDMIVANPPYVAENDPHLDSGDVRFEPRHALSGGADGFGAIKMIVAASPAHLNPGGWLLFEHGYDQATRCRTLMEEAGFMNISCHNDLAGIPRVTGGSWPAGRNQRDATA